MILKIAGEIHHSADVRVFRLEHNLPENFGVATFEPKNYTGLASLDHAGEALNYVRDAVLAAIPTTPLTTAELMDFIPALTESFRQALYTVNDRVKLRDVEIEYAVSGFGDVLHRLLYARIRTESTASLMPDFTMVYQAWLDDSVRVSSTVHDYKHQGITWQVQIVNHAYGRVGLVARAKETIHYVRDGTLACPAQGYMTRLLAEAARRLS